MHSRRSFLESTLRCGALAAVGTRSPFSFAALAEAPPDLLGEFDYGDVDLAPGLAQNQFEHTQSILMSLNEDSLLKPWRLRAGLPAPGPELGGWYDELPLTKTGSGGHGFAPGHCTGQWISALARGYAITRDARTHARLGRLVDLYGAAISGHFYANFRFPAYNYDKIVIGLIDAHQFAGIPNALQLLDRTTDAAEPHLPPEALDRGEPQSRWRASRGENPGDNYDESYTLPENLYLAWQRDAGDRYLRLARRYLLDRTYFDPLSEGINVLGDHHAYSFCNALSSAMQAWIATGSNKHLRAASNAFDMIESTQSFATGGWGPNESFSAPGSGALYASLSGTHRGFETPCGSYAHFKLTRYLLRVTADSRYGDSMERVFLNTVLGAKQLQPDGRAFYYSDYNFSSHKTYFPDAWPCCSGTLPQVAADYRIMTWFHDPEGIFVNLYHPSSLRAVTPGGAQLVLTQNGDYPFDGNIHLGLRLSRPDTFTLRVRIPAWSIGNSARPVIRVNGNPVAAPQKRGFAAIYRRWNDGDSVQLRLPMPLRLEHIDADHPNVVALVRGPLVLFLLTSTPPEITRRQLLAARQLPGQFAWQADNNSGSLLRLLPFSQFEDESYTTYVEVHA
jgi:DUF1680 family protein